MADSKSSAQSVANNKQLSTKNMVVLAALLSFISLVAAVLIGRALFKDLMLNNRVISKKAKAEKQLEDNLKAVPQLKANYEALGGMSDLILRYLPTGADLTIFATTLDSLARSTGVTLSSISAEKDQQSGAGSSTGPLPQTFSFEVDGSYIGVLSFLDGVEKSGTPIVVKSVTIEGTDASMTVGMQVNSFYQPPYKLEDKFEEVR